MLQLKNTTNWPNFFLRRVLGWCCHELKLPARRVRQAVFRNSKSSWGGCARPWRHSITVCVGKAECFPTQSITHRNGHQQRLEDRVECLVWVTSHELAHLLQAGEHTGTRQGGGSCGSEIATEWHATPVLDTFRAQREALLAAWQQPPARPSARVPLSLRERRYRKAQQDLARWQRKLKLAQGKIRKYQRKLRYYARQQVPAPAPAPAQ